MTKNIIREMVVSSVGYIPGVPGVHGPGDHIVWYSDNSVDVIPSGPINTPNEPLQSQPETQNNETPTDTVITPEATPASSGKATRASSNNVATPDVVLPKDPLVVNETPVTVTVVDASNTTEQTDTTNNSN